MEGGVGIGDFPWIAGAVGGGRLYRGCASLRRAAGRAAQALLAHLLKTGLLVSDTPLGPVRIGLPLQALALLFPALHPEAGAPD